MLPDRRKIIVFSPPLKSSPMNRCRPYRLMNPLTGIWPACGDALGYRYVSPYGDEGRNNQHLGARHVSAATPPRCDGSTTILHSPFFILNWSHTFSAKERDTETGLSYFGSRYYSSDLSIWLSIDPMSGKYPSLSPYVYCADNPVKLVDPNGESISEFDENGNYSRTIKDNWWHNFWHRRTGRIVDGDGNVVQSFKFADPENDVADLKNGKITKIHFVQENEIKKMLSKAGAFNEENKVSNIALSNRYDYILRESPKNGKFDFAITGIPHQYSDCNQSLFLVDGVAHNQFNFGNFMWGAAGKALGLTMLELRSGAHYRALTQNGADGYPSQFDSSDDQFSIRMGVRYARQHNYKGMYFRVVVGSLMNNGFGN